jgi:hypothetical protein
MHACFAVIDVTLIDHVQITALARALRVNVSVAYLDGHAPDGRVDFVDFANAPGEPPLVLLYRYVTCYSLHLYAQVQKGRGITTF